MSGLSSIDVRDVLLALEARVLDAELVRERPAARTRPFDSQVRHSTLWSESSSSTTVERSS